ncbi:U-scoloptoxin(16)-Sm2a [Drosophila hydei]|uniref:U-scoloptoxin(16)-Sm2a n=1 Tax=Drosophila hydei TaxID=7224 RepID=A0A6J2SVQ0_DROHY|nr:U-scoloptoxin(16)-Sm2a [Drosophila hydei]
MKTETVVLLIVVLGAHSLLVLGDCAFGGQNLKVGQRYSPPGRCTEYTCHTGGALTAKTCPSLASLKPCKLVEDATQPFPKCCPYFDCEQNLRL